MAQFFTCCRRPFSHIKPTVSKHWRTDVNKKIGCRAWTLAQRTASVEISSTAARWRWTGALKWTHLTVPNITQQSLAAGEWTWKTLEVTRRGAIPQWLYYYLYTRPTQPFILSGSIISSKLQLDVCCLSCCGGVIWWTLTKERQAWWCLQVKLCDPCLSALCVPWCKRRYINTLPFLSFTYIVLRCGPIIIIISGKHQWLTASSTLAETRCTIPFEMKDVLGYHYF